MEINGGCSPADPRARTLAMSRTAPNGRWRFWVAGAALVVLALWLLNDILLPFVVGAVVAYFFDPVVARLQRYGLSRTLATTAVTILAALIMIGATFAIVPPVFGQIEALVGKAPEYIVNAATRLQPMIEPLRAKLGLEPLSLLDIQNEASKWAGQALALLGDVASRVAQRGVAVINLLALLFLTPVVTFYLLRDWPKVLAAIDNALPLDHADTVRKLARESNAAVAGYVRGQALVCLCLGTIYGAGMSLVGLQFGFVIGLIAGLISFIPFVGTLVGATMAIGMALAQFPPDWISVGKVAAVFLIGHLLEGNVLSPKLVGDRVGLHPVWIMFALLAGGSLFGFVGVLVAVPIAAVIGVIARFLLQRYHASALYRGADPE
jgi:predicted PurR-regulated permease PerM